MTREQRSRQRSPASNRPDGRTASPIESPSGATWRGSGRTKGPVIVAGPVRPVVWSRDFFGSIRRIGVRRTGRERNVRSDTGLSSYRLPPTRFDRPAVGGSGLSSTGGFAKTGSVASRRDGVRNSFSSSCTLPAALSPFLCNPAAGRTPPSSQSRHAPGYPPDQAGMVGQAGPIRRARSQRDSRRPPARRPRHAGSSAPSAPCRSRPACRARPARSNSPYAQSAGPCPSGRRCRRRR